MVKLRQHSEDNSVSIDRNVGSDKLLVKHMESEPKYTSILLETPETRSLLSAAGAYDDNMASIVVITDEN